MNAIREIKKKSDLWATANMGTPKPLDSPFHLFKSQLSTCLLHTIQKFGTRHYYENI